MSHSITSRGGSQDSRSTYFLRRFLYRFFCVNTAYKSFSPRGRTRLLFIMHTSRHFRGLTNRIAAIPVICVITFMPNQVHFGYFNDYRLRNARRSTISITFRFRGPLCGLYIQDRRTSAPSQRVIAFARKIRFCATFFNAQRARSASQLVIRSGTMQVIIRGRSILTTNGLRRTFMRFQDDINANERIQVINPRRFRTTRVRLFRFVRIQRPSIFLFRIVIRRLNARCFTWQDMNKVSQVKRRCLFSQVSGDRYRIRSTFF